MRIDYRKIYEKNFGPIPKDETGRTYDIHHIDGNHSNNPDNLKAVTIQEHYKIHFSQGDYGACFKMAGRMQLSPEESARLASLANKKLIENGTHHLLKQNGGSEKAVERNRKRFADPAQRQRVREQALDQLAKGIHNFKNIENINKTKKTYEIFS